MERLPSNSQNNLPAISKSVEKNLMELAVLPSVKSGLSLVDKNILNSLVQKKIKEYEGTEAAERLDKMLRFIAIDQGYTAKNEEEWKYNRVRIIQIICKYYGNISIEDVRNAFEMLTIGELDKYISVGDKKHYGNFSAEYIVRILKAYKQRQDAAIASAYEIEPQEVIKQIPVTLEQEEQGEEFVRNVVVEWFNTFKEKGTLPRNEIGYVSYHFIVMETLEKCGILVRINPTEEHRRKAYHEYMRQHSIKRVTDYDASYVRKVGINAKPLDYLSQRFADYDAIKDAFTKIIEEGKKVEDVI